MTNLPNEDSSTDALLRIWGFLSPQRRRQLLILVLASLLSAFAEFISLSSIIPLLLAITNPQKLLEIRYISTISQILNISDAYALINAVLIFFILAVLFSGFIRIFTLWLNGRMAARVGSDLSCESYRRILYQSYESHLTENSSSIIAGATTQIAYTVVALNAFLQIITSTFIALSVIITLLIVDLNIAIAAILLFASLYGLTAVISKKRLLANGKRITEKSSSQIKALNEGLGAIRDVVLSGMQKYYLKTYRDADQPLRRLQANNTLISSFPRYLLETSSLVFIALLAGWLILNDKNSSYTIPLLGTLAYGAQRLLPSLQQIYSGWASLKSHTSAMNSVLRMLTVDTYFKDTFSEPLQNVKSICLENISFCYHESSRQILTNINLQIMAGNIIGFVGKTGQGKSTIIDLIMGLLVPTSGKVLINGFDLRDSANEGILQNWMNSISHVPQSIFLADCSFAENIAFGIKSCDIDFERVREAAKRAKIALFIESTSNGYSTLVGERGVRLSGGQKQRIGLARAFYRGTKVLILDEATSALDVDTEREIIDEILRDGNNILIMIAHRLSTLSNCSHVYRVTNGKLLAEPLQ